MLAACIQYEYIYNKNVHYQPLCPKGRTDTLRCIILTDIYYQHFSSLYAIQIYITKCTFPNPAPQGFTLQMTYILFVGRIYPIETYIKFEEYMPVESNLVLDISYQKLGELCNLEGFCATFGRRVWESTFCNIYICIGYMLPTFGVYASVGGFLCDLWAQG